MNYVEHNLGDYAKDTKGLSVTQHGAYRLLLDEYYVHERPLPASVDECISIAGAKTKPEVEAVPFVLRKFFRLGPDGWRHKRCDEEIERYRERQAEQGDRKENERERQRRHRAERRELFEKLRAIDIVPAWDTKTETLRAMLRGASVTPNVTVTSHNGHGDTPIPVTRTATATQAPVTSHQSHSPEEKPTARIDLPPPPPQPPAVFDAGALSVALRRKGVRSQPMEPRLMALAEAGITPEMAEQAADAARDTKGPNAAIPAAYVYSILERWHSEPSSAPPKSPETVAAEAIRLIEADHASH